MSGISVNNFVSQAPGFTWRKAGHCRQCRHLVLSDGSLSSLEFPATYGVIDDAQHGLILFDTGYSSHLMQATERFPAAAYRWALPLTFQHEDSAKAGLARAGLRADDVKYVVVSHIHADHIAGLRDFPNARIIIHADALAQIAIERQHGGLARARHAFFPELLPEDMDARVLVIEGASFCASENELCGLLPTRPLFVDSGNLRLCELPGHSPGQIGLYFRDRAETSWLLAADAVWHSEQIVGGRAPSSLTRFVQSDLAAYKDTVNRLRQLAAAKPDLRIAPSHCADAFARWGSP